MSLSSIRKRFRAIAVELDAPAVLSVFRTKPIGFGERFCGFDGDTYSYVLSERGEEYDHQYTVNPDELLFWVVRDMTRSMATDFEFHNRPPEFEGDTRIVWMNKHVELLEKIKIEWAVRQRQEYDVILANHQ